MIALRLSSMPEISLQVYQMTMVTTFVLDGINEWD